MKSFFILLVMLVASLTPASHVVAQELNFKVAIDATQIPDLQPYIVEDMKSVILSFLNNRNWTEDQYKAEERIDCNMAISLVSMPSQNSYQATVQVQSARPVYGTTYQSVTLNYFDKQFNFDLVPGQPLNYNENLFSSKLVSLLSFYAYVVLAVDYDSYGKLAGSKHIEKALNIANIARESVGEGWSNGGDPNNRAALIENLNSQQLIPFREGWYTYHRKGMDTYLKDPVVARQIIYEQLETIKKVNQVKPYAILLRCFFFSKRDEMINVFKESELPLKNKALPLLRELDPTNSEKYQAIMKN